MPARPRTPGTPGTPGTVTRVAAVALAAAVIAAGGCSVIYSHDYETVSGTFIDDLTLNFITPGVTTEAEALARLGAPTRSIEHPADADVVHVYEYRKTRVSSGSLFLVFSGNSRQVEERTVSLLVRDGIVTDWWRSPSEGPARPEPEQIPLMSDASSD